MKKSSSFRGAAYSCALAMLLSGCGGTPAAAPQATPKTAETAAAQPYTGSTLVQDVINGHGGRAARTSGTEKVR